MELKGTNGTIIVYNDRVIIRRKGFFAFVSQGGLKGDTTYFFHNLNGVEYKKPGMTNGYIRFIVAGTTPNNIKSGLLSTSKDALNDPNTVILRAFNKQIPILSEKIYHLIMEKISKKQTNHSNGKISSADEIIKFKKLLDQGIITQSEFDLKKKQLLGL